MNAKLEYIQLESGEDVPSIRDRLSFIRGKRVILIWPEEGTALTRKLDLVFVQREAKRRVIQLALVTHDELVIEHAKELGISTFETIQDAERSRWKRGRTRVFIQRHHKPEHEPDPEDLMPIASRIRNQSRQLPALLRGAFQSVILLIVLSAVGAIIIVGLPSAQVNLILAQQAVSIETEIIADPNPAILDIDVENRVIPATRLVATVQTVQSIETTGTAQGEEQRARGVVTFRNQTPRSIAIPANTIVSTSAGTPIRFQTTVADTLPGQVGSSVDIAIQAVPESSGSIGNVPAGLINTVIGSLSNDVTVRNLQPTTGGESQTFPIVLEADRDRLMGMVRAQLQATAFSEMEENLSETQIIVIESVHIPEGSLRSDWINYSHEVGDFSSTLTLDMRAVVEALVIDDRFARQIVFTQLSTEKPPNLSLQPESYFYTRGPVIRTGQFGEITFSATGDAVATAQINVAELQQTIAGKSLEQATAIIEANTDLAAESHPEIMIKPSWFPRMPLLPFRIRFNVDGQN